ncbi:MAG: hypothetical protein JW840_07910 [Candidatus Thermoplasmatota archaeon]|nr:hypothetical protein [Candidatus Thermoplasmatota archaeon]
MNEEENVQSKSINVSKINQLKQQIKGLRGKLYEKKKNILATEERILHRGTEPGKRFYVLAKYKRTGEWVQFGTYDSSVEVNTAVNHLKDDIRNRRGKFSQYFVTSSEREIAKFVRGQQFREREYHQKMKEELQEVPYSRYAENIKTGLKIQEPKQISKTVEQYSGYSGKPTELMPRMAVGVFGSISQPRRTNLPTFGVQEGIKPRKQKLILPNEEYQSYLDTGYTRKQLSELGIFSKRSEFYQETSSFPNAVVYRPVGYHQSFVHINPPLTEYQRRMVEGKPWGPFKPKRIFL